jgi:hypothetical protein
MKLNKQFYILYAFIAFVILPILGAVGKIMHLPFANSLLMICLVIHVPILLYALFHLFTTSIYSKQEKIMWCIGLIFISPFILFFFLWFAPQKAEWIQLKQEQQFII